MKVAFVHRCTGLSLAVGSLAGLALALQSPVAAAAITLAAPQPFLLAEADLELTLSGGGAGARYVVLASSTPAAISAGQLGSLYLAPGTFRILGSGLLDGAGAAQAVFPAPEDLSAGDRLYVQVLELAATRSFSNSVALRREDALPIGQRASRALALTSDGSRAYVVHEVDGTVTVVDANANAVLAELPITTGARAVPYRAVDVAVSPDDEYAYVTSATADFMTVIEVASGSVVAEVPVPRGSRRVGFDFSAPNSRVYVTNDVANAVLVFRVDGPGRYTRLANVRARGQLPNALLVLPDGKLLVGHRVLGELELLDPALPPAQQSLARTGIEGVPFELTLAEDGDVRVATFVLSRAPGVEGANQVLRVDSQTLDVLGVQLENVATDYKAMAVDGQLQVVAATGNGVTVIADLAGTVLDMVDLAPGQPNATPEDVEFVFAADGSAERLYVLDFFRETIRPISLTGGPPYALGEEIALAWSGQPRVPFTAETSDIEDGLYLFSSVGLMGGDAQNTNLVTCQSCHIDGVSDNLPRSRQVPTFWGITQTAPYGATGGQADLSVVNGNAIIRHNSTGDPAIVENAQALFEIWLEVFQPPTSVFVNADGSLTDDALAGKDIFEAIGCQQCHEAPLFIPVAPNPLTIEEGIGTGLAPANVPSLRGVWATAPYMHNGSSLTLRDAMLDVYPDLVGGLTGQQLDQLVEYLKTL
ncbi:MAG: beta-propeller fold lactonase family protein [Pseudomonadota bacterium]